MPPPRTLEAMPSTPDGGRTWICRVKKGIFFTPDPAFRGKPRELTAADYAYSYRRVLDPAVKSPWLWLLEGKLAGSDVFSYVWPTTIDPYEVGFEKGAGILAMAVTAHPDFDDTPLYDENGDGRRDNDGNLWHSHWVVLKPNDACGPGALGVVDIPEGSKPRLPKTWPGFPILLDSPGWSPTLNAETVEVKVPFDDIGVVTAGSFDGVTAGLRVNASVHAPLLCVVDVFKVASGNLSLPGKPNQ